jgi:hypothetical protein
VRLKRINVGENRFLGFSNSLFYVRRPSLVNMADTGKYLNVSAKARSSGTRKKALEFFAAQRGTQLALACKRCVTRLYHFGGLGTDLADTIVKPFELTGLC